MKFKANCASECDKKDELGKMYRYIFISYKYINRANNAKICTLLMYL